jgi:hypothetical protein
MHLLLASYLFVFVCDTLNLDVLYASLFGRVTFVDDSAITDSLFDSGNAQHASLFTQTVRSSNRLLSFASHALSVAEDGRTQHNAVYEDDDSPGIQDAYTSAAASTGMLLPRPEHTPNIVRPALPIDRIITFQQILI